MKIVLNTSVAHNDVFWNRGACIEAEEKWAKFHVGIGDARLATADDVLSSPPDPGPARRSIETDAMEKAAASIAMAVAKASSKGKEDK